MDGINGDVGVLRFKSLNGILHRLLLLRAAPEREFQFYFFSCSCTCISRSGTISLLVIFLACIRLCIRIVPARSASGYK
ncbi:hypothetical protein D3C75_1192910 [compost metagenome]